MITYPLSLPSEPGLSSVKWRAVDVTGMNVSPFTGQAQVYRWMNNSWMAQCGLPAMRRAKAEKWIAFLLSLRGSFGTFLLGDPLYQSPTGDVTVHIQTLGGADALKYYLDLGDTRVRLTDYEFKVIIHNVGVNDLIVESQAIATEILIPAGDTQSVRVVGTSGGQQAFRIGFKPAGGSPDSLDFWAAQPIVRRLGYEDDNLVPPASRLFGSGWQASGGATVTVTPPKHASSAARSSTISIDGFLPMAERVLAAGDYIQAGSGSTQRLYKVLTDADADTGGAVSVDVFPTVREAIADNTELSVIQCKGVFRLPPGLFPDWSVDRAKTYGLEFQGMEAI